MHIHYSELIWRRYSPSCRVRTTFICAKEWNNFWKYFTGDSILWWIRRGEGVKVIFSRLFVYYSNIIGARAPDIIFMCIFNASSVPTSTQVWHVTDVRKKCSNTVRYCTLDVASSEFQRIHGYARKLCEMSETFTAVAHAYALHRCVIRFRPRFLIVPRAAGWKFFYFFFFSLTQIHRTFTTRSIVW